MQPPQARYGLLLLCLATVTVGCGSKSSPASPSTNTLNESARSAIADTVGSATMAALFAGSAQSGTSGVQSVDRVFRSGGGSFPQASSGQTYSTSSCTGGGRVDLVYVRDYVPAGGVLDTSALKAVFAQCAFSGSGSSGQLNGQLAMSGSYQGVDQTLSIRVTGMLSTSSGDCTVDGNFDLTGAFSGTACGAPAKSTPSPRSSAAQAAVGSYGLSQLDGQGLPRVVVDRPCTGYMDTGSLNLKSDGTYDMTMHGFFVCNNGDGPKVSYAEPGTWAMFDGNTIVFATAGRLFQPSSAAVGGGAASMRVDVPSSAPDIPPARMTAVFRK
jgi:hypothetical protein